MKNLILSMLTKVDLFPVVFPFWLPFIWPVIGNSENNYRAVTTTKVVNYHSILDSVVVIDKGSTVSTKNLLYDAETGSVVVSRTNNEFDKPVYTTNYPAYWAYSGMGPAYKKINAEHKNVVIKDGKITDVGGNGSTIDNYFESGDEIYVVANDKVSTTSGVNPCTGEGSCAALVYRGSEYGQKIWAINASKISDNADLSGIYLFDEQGNFYTTDDSGATIKIIRSGNRNILSSSAGTVGSLASPIRKVGSEWKLIIDENTGVVNASASTFKDFWQVEDTKHQVGIVTKTKINLTKEVVFTPINTFSIYRMRPDGCNSCNHYTYYAYTNQAYFEAAHIDFGGSNGDGNLKSWLEFDLSSIPANAKIKLARLELYPHTATHNVPQNEDIDGHGARQTHGSTDPHNYSDDNGPNNEANIGREIYSGFNTLNIDSLIHEDDAQAKDAYDNSGQENQQLVPATTKQNSYSIKVDEAIQAMVDNRTQRSFLSIVPRLFGTTVNRLCFWGTDNNPPKLKVTYVEPCTDGDLAEECDSFYCVKETTIDTCQSYITDSTVNPYRFNILGNWRVNRTYVYYGDRKEKYPSVNTDISSNGALENFEPYWSFAENKITPASNTSKWKWNSESTLIDQKGSELENRDPLNRYNSGQYGYDKTLPVAITQNSPYKEQAYDGFEDYYYPSNSYNQGCTVPRHFDIGGDAQLVTNEQAHTGTYSLKVAANSSVNMNIALDTQATNPPFLQFDIDTMIINNRFNINNGGGLKETVYTGYNYDGDNNGSDNYNNSSGTSSSIVNGKNINYDNQYSQNDDRNGLVPPYEPNYKIEWDGKLVPIVSGKYIFKAGTDNSFKLWLDGHIIINAFPNDPVYDSNTTKFFFDTVNLIRGKKYTVHAEHTNGGTGVHTGYAHLSWKMFGQQDFSIVPVERLYHPDDTSILTTTDITCYDYKGI